MKQLIRHGKKPTPAPGEEVRPKPLKVVFADEKSNKKAVL